MPGEVPPAARLHNAMDTQPVVVAAYGAGTNSTAMLVGMVQRAEPVDLILFADTGGERPETYRFIETFDAWLHDHGYPGITVVQRVNRRQDPVTLEGLCLAGGQLPSLAYGYKKCSEKHKVQPQERYTNRWAPASACWAAGSKVLKLIGFGAEELRRIANAEARAESDKKYSYRFPLVEWGWGREQCIEAIRDAGLPLPGKSACFYCPSTRKQEIVDLAANHPDLLQRALDIEDAARPNLTSVRGLGRRFSWREFCEEQGLLDKAGKVKAGRISLAVLADDEGDGSIPCECYDGGCSLG